MSWEVLLGYGRFLRCSFLRSDADFQMRGIFSTANVSISLRSGPFLTL